MTRALKLAESPSCKICHAPGQVPRRREFHFGDVSIEIEMPLCAGCADELPAKMIDALQSPMLRTVLKILGVTFDLDLAAEALEQQKRPSA